MQGLGRYPHSSACVSSDNSELKSNTPVEESDLLTKRLILGGGKYEVFPLLFFFFLVAVLGMGRCAWKHQGLPQNGKCDFGQIYYKGKLSRKADGANLIFKSWERRESTAGATRLTGREHSCPSSKSLGNG